MEAPKCIRCTKDLMDSHTNNNLLLKNIDPKSVESQSSSCNQDDSIQSIRITKSTTSLTKHATKHNCERVFQQFEASEVTWPPVPPNIEYNWYYFDEDVQMVFPTSTEQKPPVTYVFGRSSQNPNVVQFVHFHTNNNTSDEFKFII